MTIQSTEHELLTQAPDELKRNFMSFTRMDVIAAAMLALIAVVVLGVYGKLFGLIAACICAAFMYRFSAKGRLYYVVGLRFRSTWIKRVQKNVIWVGPDLKPVRRQILRRPPPIPLKLTRVGDIAAVHFVGHQSDALVVTGSGSPIASLNLLQQLGAHGELAQAFKRTAHVASTTASAPIGVSFMFRRRPVNLVALSTMLNENVYPDLLEEIAEPMTDHEKRMARVGPVLDELIDMCDESGGDITMASIWTIGREGAIETAVKRGGLPRKSIKRLLVAKVAQAAIEGLEACGVEDVKALDFVGLQEFMRAAWDVKNLDSYQEEVFFNPPGEISELHWPQSRIQIFNDCCLIDGTYHSVVRIQGCPALQLPSYMRELFAADTPWLTVTLVGETVDSTREEIFLNRIIPLTEEFNNQRGIVHKSSRKEARERQRKEREEEIYLSRHGQAYNLLIAVSHPDKEELENGVDQVLRTCRAIDLSVARIVGEAWQLAAFWSATTGINML
jgi:hypothetical protein